MDQIQKTEYLTAFLAELQPSQSVGVLRDRVNASEALNEEVAEWISQRIAAEETYIRSLQRLARHPLSTEAGQGPFPDAWKNLISTSNEVAESHITFANGLSQEIQKEIKGYAHRRDWTDLRTDEQSLLSIAMDLEGKAQGNQKNKKRNFMKNKNEVPKDPMNARAQWDSQAPYVFEKFQTLDEHRLDFLKGLLVRYETLEAEQAQRCQSSSERHLSRYLDLDVSQGIRHFTSNAGTANGDGGAASPMPRQISTPSRTHSNLDDSSSMHSGNSLGASGGSSGLKSRVGTIFKKKNRQSTFLGRKAASAQHQSPTRSRYSDTDPERVNEARPGTAPSAPLPIQREETPSVDSAQRALQQSATLEEERQPMRRDSLEISEIDANSKPLPPMQTSPFRFEPPAAKEEELANENDAAMEKVASSLRSQPSMRSRQRGRREARNSMFPVNEDAQAKSSPFDSILDQPNEESASQGPTGPMRSSPTKGVEDRGPPTPSKPSASRSISLSSDSSATDTKAPSFPRPAPLMSNSSMVSETNSVRSAGTSVMGQPVIHPTLSKPGISASIIESVSSVIINGATSRAMMIGEVAMLYNPQNSSANDAQTATIKLVHPPDVRIKNAIPNPAVSKTAENQGTLDVNLRAIANQGVVMKYQVDVNESNMKQYVPLILTPTVRHELNQSSVILTCSGNPSFRARGGQIMLHDVVISLALEGTIPTSARSKPAGEYNRRIGKMIWKFDQLAISPYDQERLLARFNVSGTINASPVVDAKWRTSVEDEISFVNVATETRDAGVGNTKLTEVTRMVQSSRYVAT